MSIAKICTILLWTVMLFNAGSHQAAAAQYKIPDDCLGDWDYCDSLWLGGFDRFAGQAFIYRPLPRLHGVIGCSEGRDILARQGFERVRSIECRAPAYIYLVRWEGQGFRIRLSARSGRILSISPR
jgi:hypothetical protein